MGLKALLTLMLVISALFPGNASEKMRKLSYKHRNIDQLTYDSEDIIWCNMNHNDCQWENDEQLYLKLKRHIEDLEIELEIEWNYHLEMMRRASIHIRELEQQLAIAVSRKEREFEFINLAKLKYVLLATHVLGLLLLAGGRILLPF